MKFTPTLTFVPDAVPANARHIEELLRTAAERDSQIAEAAQGAEFAGGPTRIGLPARMPKTMRTRRASDRLRAVTLTMTSGGGSPTWWPPPDVPAGGPRQP